MKAFIKLLLSFTWLFVKFGWSIRPHWHRKEKRPSHLVSNALMRHPTHRTNHQLRVLRGREYLSAVARKKREFIARTGTKPNLVTIQNHMWNLIKEYVMSVDFHTGQLSSDHTKLLGMRVQLLPTAQAEYMPHDVIVIGYEPTTGGII